jgi:hypothetical protein
MIKKIALISFIIIFLILFGTISPPTALDNPNNNIENYNSQVNYTTYESNIWSETVHSVNESESHFLDLGTRTMDGSMHIYIKSQAPSSNYVLDVKSIDKVTTVNSAGKSETGLVINSNVTERNKSDTNFVTSGSSIVTDVDKHIEIQEYVESDFDYVEATITDGWGETKILERDACGCVLTEDPRPIESEIPHDIHLDRY